MRRRFEHGWTIAALGAASLACVQPERAAPSVASAGAEEAGVGAAQPAAPRTALVLDVEGMTCGGCAWQVEDALAKVPGFVAVRVSLEEKNATVTYDPRASGPDAFTAAVQALGYRVSGSRSIPAGAGFDAP